MLFRETRYIMAIIQAGVLRFMFLQSFKCYAFFESLLICVAAPIIGHETGPRFLAWQNLQAASSLHAISILRGLSIERLRRISKSKFHVWIFHQMVFIGMFFIFSTITKTGGLGRLHVFKASIVHNMPTRKSILEIGLSEGKSWAFLRDQMETFNALQSFLFGALERFRRSLRSFPGRHCCFVLFPATCHGAAESSELSFPGVLLGKYSRTAVLKMDHGLNLNMRKSWIYIWHDPHENTEQGSNEKVHLQKTQPLRSWHKHSNC